MLRICYFNWSLTAEWPWGKGGWQGLQHNLAEQPSWSKVQFLLQWKTCPWHRAGGQASWDRELSQTHTQPWQQGAGRAEA